MQRLLKEYCVLVKADRLVAYDKDCCRFL